MTENQTLSRPHANQLKLHSQLRSGLHICIVLGLLLGFLVAAVRLTNVMAIAAGQQHSQALMPADFPTTAEIVDVAPNPRNSSVSTIAISFNAPVSGVDKYDLQLTWDGIPLDLGSAVLSGSGSHYILSGLESLTKPVGSYTLTLVAHGSGIQDTRGNSLASDAVDVWTMQNATVSMSATICERLPNDQRTLDLYDCSIN